MGPTITRPVLDSLALLSLVNLLLILYPKKNVKLFKLLQYHSKSCIIKSVVFLVYLNNIFETNEDTDEERERECERERNIAKERERKGERER